MTRNIYLYDAEGADFTTLGYGPIAAIDAVFAETGNGDSSLTATVAFDEKGIWSLIQPEMILAAYVPVRMTPELDGGKIVTGVEKWKVKETASKTQRVMYTTKNGNEKKDKLPKGTSVTVVKKPTDAKRYKIKASKYGTGWMDKDALEYEVDVTLPNDPSGIETAETPWIISKQLFRIHNYVRNETSITVEARHITYDLLGHSTKYYEKGASEAQTALAAILENTETPHDFSIQSNITGTRTGVDWRYINPISALLDPEKGFIARWGGYLIRDNYEMTIMADVATNRGIEITYGKNLQGVEVQADYSNIATAVLPLGRTESGGYLRLTDDGSGDIIRIEGAESAIERIYVLDCAADATVSDSVGIGLARDRMREAAEEFIASGPQIPTISMTVDFLQLGDTDEYAEFRELERVYLYDWVRVSLANRGIDSLMQVSSIEYDPVRQRFIKAYLGDGIVSLSTMGLAAFQIPRGLNGYKILPGTIGGGHLTDDVINARHIQADSITARNIQADSIATRHLQAGSVTADKIQAGTINADLIEAGTIIAELIAAGAITADKITAGAITADKIAAGAITADKIAAGAIEAEKIAAGTITAEQLQAGLITADSGLIAVGAIQTAQIADASITSAKIVSLSADVIESGTLKTDRLLLVGEGGVVYEINAASSGLSQTELSKEQYQQYLNGTVIVANSITAAQIAAETITANEIASNAITAAKINVADLFASQATINAINAMDISGNTYLRLVVEEVDDNSDKISLLELTADGLTTAVSDNGKSITRLEQTVNEFSIEVEDEFDEVRSAITTEAGKIRLEVSGTAGVNLLRNSGQAIENKDYPTAVYELSEIPKDGEVVTVTIYSAWTEGTNKYYSIYHGDGSTYLGDLHWASTGRYTGTFSFRTPPVSNPDNAGQIRVYVTPRDDTMTTRIGKAKLERGDRSTEWTPSPLDPASGLVAGTTVEITEDMFKVISPKVEFEIPDSLDADDEKVVVGIDDEDGLTATKFSLPGLVKSHDGGMYTVGSGGDYANIIEAFGELNDKHIMDDVYLKLLDNDIAQGELRGVTGPGRIHIAPINMANWGDENAWSTAGSTDIVVWGSGAGFHVISSISATYRNALLNVGYLGSLGLKPGMKLTARATMSISTGTAYPIIVLFVGSNYVGQLTGPQGTDTSSRTVTETWTIPEGALPEDVVELSCRLSSGVANSAGARVNFTDVVLEIGDRITAPNGNLATYTASGMNIDSCGSETTFHSMVFTEPIQARQSPVSVNRCTFTGSNGLILWGGNGAMYNCYGTCAGNAVSARGGGVVEIYGSAPAGAKAGMLDTTNMTGDAPAGDIPSADSTLSFEATNSGTYSGSAWMTEDAALRQGFTTTTLRGGVWFDLSSISGKTISKATLRLRRVEGYGKGGDVTVYVYGTKSAALSGRPSETGSAKTVAMGPGKTKVVDVTSILANAQNGNKYGFVLLAPDSAVMSGKSYSTNYARFTGTGGGNDTIPLLTVTYR